MLELDGVQVHAAGQRAQRRGVGGGELVVKLVGVIAEYEYCAVKANGEYYIM